MPKEKEEIAPKEEEQPEPTKPTELSAEEQLTTITEERDRLIGERDGLSTKLESANKGLGTAQQTIRQRDASLRRQRELEDEIGGLTDLVKMYIAYDAESKGKPPEEFEEATKTRAPEFLKDFDKIQVKRKSDAQLRVRQEESQQKSEDAEARVLALGLTETDEDYRRVYNLVGEALKDPFKWAWVEADLAKLEKKSKETKAEEKPSETEAEMKERIKREILEESGELTAEGVSPSATGGMKSLTQEKLAEMRKSPDFFKWFKEHEAEIDALYNEGKIK